MCMEGLAPHKWCVLLLSEQSGPLSLFLFIKRKFKKKEKTWKGPDVRKVISPCGLNSHSTTSGPSRWPEVDLQSRMSIPEGKHSFLECALFLSPESCFSGLPIELPPPWWHPRPKRQASLRRICLGFIPLTSGVPVRLSRCHPGNFQQSWGPGLCFFPIL